MRQLPLGKGRFALVDDNDFEMLAQYRWTYHRCGYAYNDTWIDGKHTKIWMHRLVMNPPGEKQVDHINGNKLDNRKENLRLCTQSQNSANAKVRDDSTSGYKGVTKSGNGWMARIGVGSKRLYIGMFLSREEAAKAYNEAAEKHFGEFARLNVIGGLTDAHN